MATEFEPQEERSLCTLLTGFEEGAVLDNKYVIDGVLGVGGMGVVLAATHIDLDRQVAIKLLRAELAREDRIVARLLREGRAAARIKSEHVAQVIDVGRLASGTPYVVMERLEGEGFDRLLERTGPFAREVAVDAIVETCEALAEAHAAGIVHRDLKPGNLFLALRDDGSTIVKLLDFGISKTVGASHRRSLALTDPHLALGSPNYMAPEQIKAADDVDPRCDVWALGAILYELVTGQQAFDADDVNVLQARILLEEHLPLRVLRPDLPSALERIVRRCLMKDRAARYPNVEALARDLAPFGSERALRAIERIVRLTSGAPRVDSVPPPSSGSFASVLPVSARGSRVGRGLGYAAFGVTLALVAGFIALPTVLPVPRALERAAAGARSATEVAARFAKSSPRAVPAPGPIDATVVPELTVRGAQVERKRPRAPENTSRSGYGWTPRRP